MTLEEIKLFGENNLLKIKLKDYTWNILTLDPTPLYDYLSQIILNRENLIYYCASISSAKTRKDVKKYVKQLIRSKNIDIVLDDIFTNLGWNDKAHAKVGNTVFEGDLCEYLMNILIDRLSISDTLISKISLKTSPAMSVHGNDNVFYDADSKKLYFGEAKFDSSLYDCVYNAFNSISAHMSTLEEISFIRTHTADIICDTGKKRKKIIEKFESLKTSDISLNSISFCMFEKVWQKADVENIIKNFFISGKIDDNFLATSYIILLPIIDKTKFLNYLISKL